MLGAVHVGWRGRLVTLGVVIRGKLPAKDLRTATTAQQSLTMGANKHLTPAATKTAYVTAVQLEQETDTAINQSSDL